MNQSEDRHETPVIQPDRASDEAAESFPLTTGQGVALEVPAEKPEPLATTRGTLTAEELESAIARLTRALATATDEEIGELVAERRAMRHDLEKIQRSVLPDNVRPIRAASKP